MPGVTAVLSVIVAFSLLAAQATTVAASQGSPVTTTMTGGRAPCRASEGGTAVTCEDDVVSSVPGGAPSGPQPSAGPRPVYVPYPSLTPGPDGQSCVGTGYYQQGSPRPADASPGVAPSPDRVPGQEEYNILYRDYPPCPEAEPAAGAADTPGAFAARFWSGSVCRCPSPTLASPRAEALTEAT